jgi:hypothetical protein
MWRMCIVEEMEPGRAMIARVDLFSKLLTAKDDHAKENAVGK